MDLLWLVVLLDGLFAAWLRGLLAGLGDTVVGQKSNVINHSWTINNHSWTINNHYICGGFSCLLVFRLQRSLPNTTVYIFHCITSVFPLFIVAFSLVMVGFCLQEDTSIIINHLSHFTLRSNVGGATLHCSSSDALLRSKKCHHQQHGGWLRWTHTHCSKQFSKGHPPQCCWSSSRVGKVSAGWGLRYTVTYLPN